MYAFSAPTPNKKEAGNVLFMILIAVALFATLAYAVTGSTRSSGGDASREQLSLYASQVTQYSTQMENSIQRMRLSNGCADTQISFENNIASGYTNPNAPANYTCHVFRPEGGNVPFQKPPNGANDGSDYHIMGRTCVVNVGTGGENCYGSPNNESEADLVLYLPSVSKSLCITLNDKLGVTNPSGNPPVENNNGIQNEKFTGSYYNNGLTQTAGGTASALNGKLSGCFQAGPGVYLANQYHFYHVLIPR